MRSWLNGRVRRLLIAEERVRFPPNAMKKERIVEVLAYLGQVLREDYNITPSRLDDYDRRRRSYVRGGTSGFGHVLWMCREAQKLAEAGRTEKACRWLGFVQGFLWAKNVFAIEDFKDMGRVRPENAPVLKVGDHVRLKRAPGVRQVVREVRSTGYTVVPLDADGTPIEQQWLRTEATADPFFAEGAWEPYVPTPMTPLEPAEQPTTSTPPSPQPTEPQSK